MGCGVSKLDLEEASRGEFKILHHKANNSAVADSTMLNKQLLEMSKSDNNDNNINEKEAKINNASENEGQTKVAKKEEDGESRDRDAGKDDNIPENSILYPGSPSFRDYCILSNLSADSSNDRSGDGSVGEPQDKCPLNNSKGVGKQEPKRGRIGRGFKNVKNLLSHPAASMNDASRKTQVRAWD